MQITLNLKDETEFLAEIKEIVRAKVKELAREEAQSILKEELTKLLQDKVKGISDSFISQNIQNVISTKIQQALGSGWYNASYVKEEASKLIEKITKNELEKIDFTKTAVNTLNTVTSTLKNEFLKRLLDK